MAAALGVGEVSGAPQALLLAVRLNGVDLPGDVAVLCDQEAERSWLAIDRSAWDRLGLLAPRDGALMHDGQLYARVADDGPLRWVVDAPTQTLLLEAGAMAFSGGGARMGRAPHPPAAEGLPGAFVGYDIAARRGHHQRASADGLLRMGIHGSSGAWLESWSLLSIREGRWQHHRLETRWTAEDAATQTRWTLGDTVRPASSAGAALPLTGLQWARDPSLDPGQPTMALPAVRGEALLPSTFELRVNGTPASRGELGPGLFVLDALPVAMGDGRLQLVIRDALGRERVIEQPYHASPALLRPGLRAWSLDLGRLRHDPLASDARTGPWVVSWLERRGLTPALSAQWRVESVGPHRTAAAAAWWRPPALPDGSSLGVLQADSGWSHGPTGRGWLRGLGWSREADRWSARALWQRAEANAGHTGPTSAAPWRTRLAASLGWRWGQTGLAAHSVRQDDGSDAARRWTLGSLSRSLGARSQWSLRWQHDGRTGERMVGLLLTVTGDDGTTSMAHGAASSGGSRRRDTTLRWQQHEAAGGPRVALQLEEAAGRRGSLELRSADEPVAWAVGLQAGAGESTLALAASGQLAWVAGRFHAGARQDGSAALVELDGLPGVPVLHEQRVVARTDATGAALVTGLRSHELNRISAEAGALPMQVELLADGVQIVPPARGVVRVRLPLVRQQSVVLRILDRAGQPLPAGSAVQTDVDGARALVGHDGIAYVSWPATAGQSVTIEATHAGGRCYLRLVAPGGLEPQPHLGERRCE